MRLLTKLKRLNPNLFENLIYDLLSLQNLVNLTWRTPGSDGGRDIEGDYYTKDFSGGMRLEKWYIECKRHSATVDWPTVYGKLAYAENHGADYLLICTTGTLSPRCKDEIDNRERRRAVPRLRAWEGPYLELMISDEPLLLIKYGLSTAKRERELGALPLAQILAKTTHQIYGETDPSTPSIEFAAAIAELTAIWLQPLSGNASGSHSLVPERDSYSWVKITKKVGLDSWDSYEFRALLTATRFLSRVDKVEVEFTVEKGTSCARLAPAPSKKTRASQDILNTLAVVADWEWRISNRALFIRKR